MKQRTKSQKEKVIKFKPLDQTYSELFKIIDRKSNLSAAVRKKYKREIEKLSELSIDPNDIDDLSSYMEVLTSSSRKFLQPTINEWYGLGKKSNVIKTEESSDKNESYVWLTIEQVRKLLSQFDTGKLDEGENLQDRILYLTNLQRKVILGLFIGLGLRRKEALEISWDSIKEKGIVEVYRNGIKHRSVLINTGFMEVLNEWGAVTGKNGKILRSIDEEGSIGSSPSVQCISDIVSDFGKAGGIENLTPESLRRGYAQISIQLGHSIVNISKWLGHRNVGESIRYLAANEDVKKVVCDELFKNSEKELW